MQHVKKIPELINIDDTITTDSLLSSFTTNSSMIASAIQFSAETKNRKLFTNQPEQYINNSFHRSKLGLKSKRKKKKYKKPSRQPLFTKSKKQKSKQQKRTIPIHTRSNKSNKNKRTRSSTNRKRSLNSITKRKRTSALTHPSRRQQYKLKTTKINNTKSAQNRKKSRGNTSTRTIGYQRSRSVAKSSTKSLSSPQGKQHIFGKRDRTTSLMALQALAEKIAMYKEKYGNIETRHSSIITPPKLRKRPKQRRK